MTIKQQLAAGFAALLMAMPSFANIQHVVVFRYQPGVSAPVRAENASRFVALKSLAKRDGRHYIVSIVGGKAISREGFDQSFDEAFVVTFKNEADRNYFVGKPYSEAMDPDHLALAKVVEPLLVHDAAGKLTGLFVFDFDDKVLAR